MDEYNDNHNKTKTKLIKKLISFIIKEGFQQLRMDDIAKTMDVSRATMYKYFSSKEEVIESVVNVFVEYINKLIIQPSEDNESSFGSRFQQLFEQSVILAGYITDVFLKELQVIYPDAYARLKGALYQRELHTIGFYQDGMTSGIFNQINEKFILLQDDVLLREIINIKYLLLNQVSLQQVLHDYYIFKKIQLFKAEKLVIVDDSRMTPIIDHIVQSITVPYKKSTKPA
ncbi:TetR/AcrR family transcriptional regulator [Paenibacillus sp. N3.4]|uniref:TetR/AcrR family transcriptional regulator n=1 Tax=Paenibacillus sp. N3.4 TaxID=2603222 RepID=UPI0011C74F59|nr:TetR/AcrR family transcriptional regulator [Paenibacillus sp. N3.4]TXK86130.1 TetR/AcrR family transcriptional regulator [Paenibacillus sp. N3.4]